MFVSVATIVSCTPTVPALATVSIVFVFVLNR